MQIRPATLNYLAEQAGIGDLSAALEEDPTLDVRLGVRYLKSLKDRFGSVDKALFAYNLGPSKMIRLWKANGLGQYKGYLRAVKRDYAQLQRETGVSEDWTLASR
jgi:soluble lytic murein transglycosylase